MQASIQSVNGFNVSFKKYSHPFHMVTKSSWPFLISIMLLNLILSFTAKINLATSDFLIINYIYIYGMYINFAILVFLISR